jgi:CheY-like chemotaxis protein
LSKRLCKLLGGDIHVHSAVGKGSTFSFTLPAAYAGAVTDLAEPLIEPLPEDERIPVLAIEDDPADMMVYEATLRHSPYRLIGARNLKEARRKVHEVKPRAIILDLLLEGADTWALLADLKSAPESQGIPIIVVSTIEDRAKAARLGADGYGIKPIERAWLLAKLHELIDEIEAKRVLLIDDDEASRYIIRRCLADEPYVLSEAATGEAGLESAAKDPPDLVLLDLKLPGISGFDVLDQLFDNPRTAQVPIVVVTATALNEHDLERLGGARQVVAKSGLSKEALAPVVAEALGGGAQP